MAPRHSNPGAGTGPSQRQRRVSELLRRRLSEVMTRGEIHDPDLNALSITVGAVEVSPDLKVATAYVVPLGGGNVELMLSLLKEHTGEVRRAVARGLDLKYAPEFRFKLDETFDQLDETRRLFTQDAVRRDLDD